MTEPSGIASSERGLRLADQRLMMRGLSLALLYTSGHLLILGFRLRWRARSWCIQLLTGSLIGRTSEPICVLVRGDMLKRLSKSTGKQSVDLSTDYWMCSIHPHELQGVTQAETFEGYTAGCSKRPLNKAAGPTPSAT